MEDVLALYARPLNPKEPVVCFDEKPVSLHSDARPPVPATKPGQIAKRDYEYVRQGTANVFYAVEPLAGRHRADVTANRSGPETAKALARVSRDYPDADTIHLVVDQLNTHSEQTLINFYGPEQGEALWSRFTVHYTPKHGSWLDQAEIGLSLLGRQCLGKRRIGDLAELKAEVKAWRNDRNRERRCFKWTFTPRKARKLFRYSPADIRRSLH